MPVSEPEIAEEYSIETIDVLAEEVAVALYERLHHSVQTSLVIEPPFDTHEYAGLTRAIEGWSREAIVIAPRALIESGEDGGIVDEIQVGNVTIKVNIV